jgi:uncharacterized delta-60 repeat protein
MPLKTKYNGDIKTVNKIIINDNGIFKEPKSGYAKHNGEWKQFYNIFSSHSIAFPNTIIANSPSVPSINNVSVTPNDSIFITGTFSQVQGVSANNMALFTSDNSISRSFVSNLGTNISGGSVFATISQPDGKIIVGGSFVAFNNQPRRYIFRLNTDGTEDTSFYTTLCTTTGISGGLVYSLSLQDNGKILIGGNFTSLNGTPRNRLIRVNGDGTEDTTFNNNLGTGFNSTVASTCIVSGDKIVVGGYFTGFNGNVRNRIVSLYNDGTEDSNFYANSISGTNGGIKHIFKQQDEKLLLSGVFTKYSIYDRKYMTRITQDGFDDTSFNTNINISGGLNNYVNKTIVYDNKIISVGAFTKFKNIPRGRIVILNDDGTEDITYYNDICKYIDASTYGFNQEVLGVNTSTYAPEIILYGSFTNLNSASYIGIVKYNTVTKQLKRVQQINLPTGFGLVNGNKCNGVGVQSNGNMIIVGTYAIYNDNVRRSIVCIDKYCNEIESFYTNIGTTFYYGINCIEVQPDDKILLGAGSSITKRLMRLNADGTPDTTFNSNLGTGFSSDVYAIKIQDDGKILVGGDFSSFNGLAQYGIIRLNSDGTADTTFNANTSDAYGVLSLAIQSDNKILVGMASTTSYNSVTCQSLIRLNSDGTEDNTFTKQILGDIYFTYIRDIKVQADGKILLAFNQMSIGSSSMQYGMLRLNSNGTIDNTFLTNIGNASASEVFNPVIYSMQIQDDGKIIVGGGFGTFNGKSRHALIRLNSDGTEDTSFYASISGSYNVYYSSDAVYGIKINPTNTKKLLSCGFFSVDISNSPIPTYKPTDKMSFKIIDI